MIWPLLLSAVTVTGAAVLLARGWYTLAAIWSGVCALAALAVVVWGS